MKIQAALAFAWFIRNSSGFRELRAAVRESSEPSGNRARCVTELEHSGPGLVEGLA